MNERIKDLYYKVTKESQAGDDIIEKFAELIVAECIQVCSNVEADTEMDLSDGALVCMAEIKEHFGVEE
jgi:hypothetical protein